MRTWPLIISIVVILAIVCSPVLAISKSDLIAYYKGQSSPAMPVPTPTATPTVTPTPTSPIPSGFFPLPSPWKKDISSVNPTGTLAVTSDPAGAPVYLDGVYKGITPIEITGVSTGFHSLRVTLDGIDHSTLITWGKTGWSYPYRTSLYLYKSYHSANSNPLSIHVTQQGIEYFDLNDIPVGKPNIYLYGDRDLTAQVRLAPEKAITVSEPAYQSGKGWLAQISNGSLNGKGDFLFYEAVVPDAGWQKQEGYVIREAYREPDMASMLGQYGFNEKETAEFIDYWEGHLVQGLDFVFYPQETAAIDRVMPLSINPEPDHAMRIWFYAEPLVSAPEPVTSPEKIIREGFYVVEWGVIIDDAYWINHTPVSSEALL
jgi:hypothetical protein